MKMINLSSDIPKFNFFDEIIYQDIPNKEDKKEKNTNILSKTPINEIKINDSININNIFVSGPREMYSINSMLFINGKLIHEQNNKMIRENLIMKISENKILDLYRVFNGVYFGFRYQMFKNKPLFIIIGGDFNEYKINNNLELFMLTSIKFYDATYFIDKELKKYPPQNIMSPKEEPYPQILMKNIKLLKRLSDSKLFCTEEDISMEGYESIQNINCFTINSDLTYAAISLDQGDIILLYAFPNFIECDINLIKIKYLPQTKFREKGHITNLYFTKLKIYYSIKNILYASTPKIIYFYEWENKQDSEENIELKILNENGPGSYNGCIDIYGKNFLMGASNGDFVYEYENLEIRKTLPFKGKKTNIFYFKEYIAIAMGDENYSLFQIFDKKHGIFIYFKEKKEKLIGVCGEDNDIYIIYEKSQEYKYIVKLTEIEIKRKLKKIINQKLFSLSLAYAENNKLVGNNISNILALYAEDEFTKGNYKHSIELYTKTIGYLQSDKIIFKFKEKSKLEYLMTYLENYLKYLEFKFNIHTEEYLSYTKLLLNSYTLTNKVTKLKEYVSQKEIYFSDEIFEYITELCFETNNIDYALNLTLKNQQYINYIKILLKLNKKDEVLGFIIFLIKNINNNNNKNLDNIQTDLNNQMKCEKIQAVFNYFTPFYIIENDWEINEKNKILETKFFETFCDFVENNYENLEEKDLINLMYRFLNLDKYFPIIFDKLINYPIFFDEKIFQKRIELYLKNGKEDDKKKILSLLSNSIYKSIYDFDSLLSLFKFYNYMEGIEFISQQRNSYKDLFFIHLNNKDHKKILDIFNKYYPKEKLIWLIALQFFVSELNNKFDNEEKNFFFKNAISLFLFKLLENEIFPSIYILQLINDINFEIPLYLLQSFFFKAMEKENNNLVNQLVKTKEYDAIYHEITDEIDNLTTKSLSIKYEKCDICNMKMNTPCEIFRCKHMYHTSCLNDLVDKNNEIYCPKCINNKLGINAKLEDINKIYKNINSPDRIETELNKYEDKVDFIDDLSTKGLINCNLNNNNE